MLAFKHAQTLSLSHKLEYLGDAFAYRAVQDIVIRGKMISDRAYDNSLGSYFSIVYTDQSGDNQFVAVEGEDYDFVDDDWIVENKWFPIESAQNIETPEQNSFFDITPFASTVSEGGTISGADHYSPLYDIWDGANKIKKAFGEFQEIILNGVSLGSGRVVSASFPESRDFRKGEYEITLEIYKPVDLYNWEGTGYFDKPDPELMKLVQNLDSTFSFDKDKNNVISYSKNLGFSLINSGLSEESYLNTAKTIASGLFYKDPNFNNFISQYPDFYENNGNRVFNESYNPLEGSFSFSEIFQGPTSGKKYFWDVSYSLTTQQNGATRATENGTIRGVSKNSFEVANSGYNSIKGSREQRIKDFYGSYKDSLCEDTLIFKAASKASDIPAGIITYSFNYEEDPFGELCYDIVRASDIQKDADGEYTLTENGSVRNTCELTTSGKLQKAVDYFKNNIETGIKSRLYSDYEAASFGCGCSGAANIADLSLISTEEEYSSFRGAFDYAYTYKTSCGFAINDYFLTSKERQVKDTLHNVGLQITPYSGEIAQKQNTSSLIEETQTISVIGREENIEIEQYLEECISNITPPVSSTFFMNNASYFFDPDNSKMEMSVIYQYTGFRNFLDINV